MSPIAQCMRVSATIGKQWLQNMTTHVLDPVEQIVIAFFDQLGGRRLVRTAVTGSCDLDLGRFKVMLPIDSLWVIFYSTSVDHAIIRRSVFGKIR